jgi:hypothetical protein
MPRCCTLSISSSGAMPAWLSQCTLHNTHCQRLVHDLAHIIEAQYAQHAWNRQLHQLKFTCSISALSWSASSRCLAVSHAVMTLMYVNTSGCRLAAFISVSRFTLRSHIPLRVCANMAVLYVLTCYSQALSHRMIRIVSTQLTLKACERWHITTTSTIMPLCAC